MSAKSKQSCLCHGENFQFSKLCVSVRYYSACFVAWWLNTRSTGASVLGLAALTAHPIKLETDSKLGPTDIFKQAHCGASIQCHRERQYAAIARQTAQKLRRSFRPFASHKPKGSSHKARSHAAATARAALEGSHVDILGACTFLQKTINLHWHTPKFYSWHLPLQTTDTLGSSLPRGVQ